MGVISEHTRREQAIASIINPNLFERALDVQSDGRSAYYYNQPLKHRKTQADFKIFERNVMTIQGHRLHDFVLMAVNTNLIFRYTGSDGYEGLLAYVQEYLPDKLWEYTYGEYTLKK